MAPWFFGGALGGSRSCKDLRNGASAGGGNATCPSKVKPPLLPPPPLPSASAASSSSSPSGLPSQQAAAALAAAAAGTPLHLRRGIAGPALDRGGLAIAQIVPNVLVMRRPWTHQTNVSAHRNNVEDVVQYLDGHYERRYQIFSLERPEGTAEDCANFSRFRDQALLFRAGDNGLRQPPPLGLLCGFCEGALFWLNLERQHNVCVLQLGDCSAHMLLFFVALLLALEAATSVDEALDMLRRRSEEDQRRTGTLPFSEPSTWMPSGRRYLEYLQAVYSQAALRSARTPGRFCFMMLVLDSLGPAFHGLTVEVYESAFDETTKSCKMRLVADSSSYEVLVRDPDQGCMHLDMSPRGQRPLWLQGDVAVVLRFSPPAAALAGQVSNKGFGRGLGSSASSPGFFGGGARAPIGSAPHGGTMTCRYFFNTAFIVAGRTDFIELTKAQLDAEPAVAAHLPDQLKVSIVLSDYARDTAESVPDPETAGPIGRLQGVRLPVVKPVGKKSEFTRFHVVEADNVLQRELEESGFEGCDAAVALQVSRNRFVDAMNMLSRCFPMSADAKSFGRSGVVLFSQVSRESPQSTATPSGSEVATNDAISVEDSPSRPPSSTASTPSVPRRSSKAPVPPGSPEGAPFASLFDGGSHDARLLMGASFKKPAPAVKQTRATQRRRGGFQATSGLQSGIQSPSLSPCPSGRLPVGGTPSGSFEPSPERLFAQPAVGSRRASKELRRSSRSRAATTPEVGAATAPLQRPGSRRRKSATQPRDGASSFGANSDSEQATSKDSVCSTDTAVQLASAPVSESTTSTSQVAEAPVPVPPSTTERAAGGAAGGVLVADADSATTDSAGGGVPAKGKGKGGAPPPPAKGKGKGKAVPPAPPVPPGAPNGVAKGAGKGTKGAPPPSLAVAPKPAVLPLGKKFHWKAISDQNLENSIWAEIHDGSPLVTANGAGGQSSVEVLERLFKTGSTVDSTSPDDSKKPKALKMAHADKDLVQILDDKRAQNVMIVISRLGLASEELCERLRTLDTKDLTIDSLQKCRDVIPTDEEIKKLAAYRGDVSGLRQVERRIYPLAFLPRLPQRLNSMTFSVQLPLMVREVNEEMNCLSTAAAQVRSSKQLRTILRVVLLLGNFVNHGAVDECPTRGFAVESLPRLADMRSHVHKSVTMLHYVTYRVLQQTSAMEGEEPSNAIGGRAALRQDLALVGPASRVSIEGLRATLDEMGQQARAVSAEAKLSKQYEEQALESLRSLQAKAEMQLDELTAQLSECERSLQDLQLFLGEDCKRTSPSALFATLQRFVEVYSAAAQDIERQPEKFRVLLNTGSAPSASRTSRSRGSSDVINGAGVAGGSNARGGSATRPPLPRRAATFQERHSAPSASLDRASLAITKVTSSLGADQLSNSLPAKLETPVAADAALDGGSNDIVGSGGGPAPARAGSPTSGESTPLHPKDRCARAFGDVGGGGSGCGMADRCIIGADWEAAIPHIEVHAGAPKEAAGCTQDTDATSNRGFAEQEIAADHSELQVKPALLVPSRLGKGHVGVIAQEEVESESRRHSVVEIEPAGEPEPEAMPE